MTIVSENLCALIPRAHTLARRARLPIGQLDGEPIVCMPVGTGIRATLDMGCAAAGFTPHVTVEASDADTVAELTRRGLGVGVLSASMTTRYAKRLAALPLTGIPLPTLLAGVWSPSPRPAARAFVPQLRAAFSG